MTTQAKGDLEYMRRLGRYVDEANEALLAEHLALPIHERLRRSFRLADQSRGYARNDRSEEDDPGAFYARARALGIITA